MEMTTDNMILIVDDEDIVLESCRRVLEADGFEVMLASSAEAALEIMGHRLPVALLMDIKMPERDGIYLMERIRKKWLEIPVIVMTGYPTSETIAEAAMMGAATLISKPFTPDELVETVSRVLKNEIKPVFLSGG
jgi:DNA-binding NtrC family response regulator